MFKMKNRRGVSPVIATILLISIVVVLAIIIFIWARAFVTEKAQKFDRAIELSCDDVNFEAGVFYEPNLEPPPPGQYFLDIVNRGDVPIYGLVIKDFTDPGTVIKKTTLQQGTITIGQTESIPLDEVSPEDQLLVVPMILGETEAAKVAHTCTDNFGYAVFVPL